MHTSTRALPNGCVIRWTTPHDLPTPTQKDATALSVGVRLTAPMASTPSSSTPWNFAWAAPCRLDQLDAELFDLCLLEEICLRWLRAEGLTVERRDKADVYACAGLIVNEPRRLSLVA